MQNHYSFPCFYCFSLTEMKKRKIKKSGLIFDSPLAAIDALMKKRPFELSTKRFITKVSMEVLTKLHLT